MLKDYIEKLKQNNDLTYSEAEDAARIIMSGGTEEDELSEFLVDLADKGESVDEICAFANVMRKNAEHTDIPRDCLDIVGTGGDKSGTFNISTCAAFVACACGVKVAKHGNVSVSSKCGAADILAKLGVDVKADPRKNYDAFLATGFAFLHAQVYHPAMRYVGPVRKKLGIRTIFNILGPLSNPASAKYQVLGVFSPDLLDPLCRVLMNLGCEHVVAVHGGGTDEVSVFSETQCCEGTRDKQGQIHVEKYSLMPEDFGVPTYMKEDILGGDDEINASIFKEVLDGKEGAYLDAVVVNAAMCLHVCEIENDFKKAAEMCRDAIMSGKAKATFEAYKKELLS